jgi:hypothetical protein
MDNMKGTENFNVRIFNGSSTAIDNIFIDLSRNFIINPNIKGCQITMFNYDTRSANNFHIPTTNLTKYQKETYYRGIQISNHLPTHIKNVASEIHVFKKTLKKFLLDNSFYSIDEYFNSNK